jgi:hypothetical protein
VALVPEDGANRTQGVQLVLAGEVHQVAGHRPLHAEVVDVRKLEQSYHGTRRFVASLSEVRSTQP